MLSPLPLTLCVWCQGAVAHFTVWVLWPLWVPWEGTETHCAHLTLHLAPRDLQCIFQIMWEMWHLKLCKITPLNFQIHHFMNIFVLNISQPPGYLQESAEFRPHAAHWLQRASLKAAHMPSSPGLQGLPHVPLKRADRTQLHTMKFCH